MEHVVERRREFLRARQAVWATAACFLLVGAQVGVAQTLLPEDQTGLIGERAALETFGVEDLAMPNPPKEPTLPPSVRFGVQDLVAREAFVLEQVSPQRWAEIEEEDLARESLDKVIRYGFWRPVMIDAGVVGRWTEIPGEGWLWTADVAAPGAIGVRLQFVNMNLPPGAQIFVYSPDYPERVWGPYQGLGHSENGEVWTPTTFGDHARVEYFVPGHTARPTESIEDAFINEFQATLQGQDFQLAACQHIYRDPVAQGQPREGTCHNDVTCYSAWANTAKASAGIGTINSDALYCSGTMIATTANDQTPYWLTANHCISSASTATNSEIYWLFQTSTCNGTPPSISTVPQSAVCTRLSYSSTSDYSLLMVEGKVPDGLYWSGWASAAVANGTNVTCVHHPDGAYKRISFATKVSGAAANFIRADWYDAPTEPGSSGSGLFRDDTKQLVGQLYGGPSSCASESYDDYGAFATTYGSISSYLSAGSDDSSENNDTCATARAMTAGTYSSRVVKRYASGDEDWYSVSVPAGATLTLSLSFTHNNGDIDLQLYNACGGSVIASSATSGNTEQVTYTNSGGSAATYYARVYLYSDFRNTYSMTISTGGGGGVPNDNCANAIVVTNGTYTGSTASATRDGSASCGSSSTTRDVWYRYTAPASGTLRLNTCGSAYDTVLSVHSACPGTSSNQLSCNDDCGGSPCGGVASCITRSVTSGTTYRIRVSGYNGASGSFTLTVTGP